MSSDAVQPGRQLQVWRHTGRASQTTVVYPPMGSLLMTGYEHPPMFVKEYGSFPLLYRV